jgi:hypothetical protein
MFYLFVLYFPYGKVSMNLLTYNDLIVLLITNSYFGIEKEVVMNSVSHRNNIVLISH